MTLRHALRRLFGRQKLDPQKLLWRRVRGIILGGPEEFLFGPTPWDGYRKRPNRERGLRENSEAICQKKNEETEPMSKVPFGHIWCSRLRILLPTDGECQRRIVTLGNPRI